jgi:hypothetical protein
MKLDGYKTFIGIAVSFLGLMGFGDIISEGEATELINLSMQLVGLLMAVYGRLVAHKKY